MKLHLRISSALAFLGTLLMTFIVRAQTPPPYTPIQAVDIGSFINTLGRVAFDLGRLLMVVAVVMILYAGFKFITAGDDESSISGAKKILAYGVVGIVVALLAFAIPVFVSTIFK